MAKSPIILPLSTTFLQRFSQYRAAPSASVSKLQWMKSLRSYVQCGHPHPLILHLVFQRLKLFLQHVETFLHGRHIGCCRVSFYYSHNCFGCIHDRRVFLLFRKLGQFNTVIYRIYDLDNSLAIIFQILCCTNRIGTWKRMGCINDNSFGFENPYLNSNRNGLFDE